MEEVVVVEIIVTPLSSKSKDCLALCEEEERSNSKMMTTVQYLL
jgi:hypothetical protein